MASHKKGFFGSKTGILYDSGPSSSPSVFFTFIKKKEDASWEKPSKKEGRAIKFSLEDIAFILRVLRKEKNAWNTVHSFEEKTISISVEWDDNEQSLKVVTGDYLALLDYGETEVLRMLLEHAFQKKVIKSTEVKKREEKPKKKKSQKIAKADEEEDEQQTVRETAVLMGLCKGETEKALLIAFWIPKSTIHSDFNPNENSSQKFEIDAWILKRNNLL